MNNPEIIRLRVRVKVGKTIFLIATAAIACLVIGVPVIMGLLFGEGFATLAFCLGLIFSFAILLVSGFHLEDLPEDMALLAYYESEQ